MTPGVVGHIVGWNFNIGILEKIFKQNILIRNQSDKKAETYVEALSGGEDSELLKS